MTIGRCRLSFEQTISQPYTVAFMCQEARLTAGDKVLEVGTGSGYGAAVLSLLAREVHTIERIEALFSDSPRAAGTARLPQRPLLLGRRHAGSAWKNRRSMRSSWPPGPRICRRRYPSNWPRAGGY